MNRNILIVIFIVLYKHHNLKLVNYTNFHQIQILLQLLYPIENHMFGNIKSKPDSTSSILLSTYEKDFQIKLVMSSSDSYFSLSNRLLVISV